VVAAARPAARGRGVRPLRAGCARHSAFFDMNKMIGTDFEAGLAKLEAVAEK